MRTEIGIHGEEVPIYDDETCELAAIEAFLLGEYGSLTCLEIEWMTDAAKECGIPLP